ncbi:MAG: TIGR04283 family arsenosugar biosynthesis glycosyltransferase [Pseudomonadota bacterium]
MISVLVPTLDSETTLAATLSALVPAVVEGLVREVIIIDGGSHDRTLRIAEQSGAIVVQSAPGRGRQIAAGARHARGSWLMVLHADTVLDPGWLKDAASFMEKVDTGKRPPGAAAFRFALDDDGLPPRILEWLVALRANLFKRPYGDQGLLIPKSLYDGLGGIRSIPIMEDLDFVSRLGGRRLSVLRTAAVTSASRYRANGYLRRILRNQYCLLLYVLGRPIDEIASVYSPPRRSDTATADSFIATGLPVEGEKDRG